MGRCEDIVLWDIAAESGIARLTGPSVVLGFWGFRV